MNIFYVLLFLFITKLSNSKILYYVTGGVTDTSFRLMLKSDNIGSKIGIYLNGNQTLVLVTDNEGYMDANVTNLTPSTKYKLELYENGVSQINNTTVTTF